MVKSWPFGSRVTSSLRSRSTGVSGANHPPQIKETAPRPGGYFFAYDLCYHFNNNMSLHTKQSDKLKSLADELLTSSKLPQILKKYGQVRFVGSYAARLMMHGDIDIHILREKEFSKQETLDIFNDIVASTKFNSYYIGDWNNTNIHLEFPYGYYIGLKTLIGDIKWKIDLWFVSTAEQNRFNGENMDVTKITLSEEQREAILSFKKYRQENSVKISGQEIYEMVINKGVVKLEEFRQLLKDRPSK